MMRGFLLAMGLLSTPVFAQVDYPSAIWRAANSGNFSTANRPTDLPVLYVVIHITEGSYSGAISWFQNAASNVSAHYVIRSSDGEVTQMVREKDIGYHAGVWWYNQRSVGIEHEATSSSSAWYTDNLYRSSAALTRYLTTKYNIPRNRTYVIGHRETGASTGCPGPFWDWNRYMALLTEGAQLVSSNFPSYMNPGSSFTAQLQFLNNSDFAWSTVSGNADYVELRTQSPDGRQSPFFASGFWVSPSRIGPPTAATSSGGTASFNVRLNAPSTPGIFTETYQLWRQSTGYFGPLITATIGVGQQDVVIDNNSTAFQVKGTWQTGTSATDKFGTDYRFVTAAPKNSSLAQWTLTPPTPGLYEVYTWWPQGTNRCSEVSFELLSKRDRIVKVFDQRTGGGQWNLVGRTYLSGSGFLQVRGNSNSSGVVMADAVRLVGPL